VQQGDDLRTQLNQLIAHFRAGARALGLELMSSLTPIQPILLADNARAMRWQQQLWDAGFWVPAIRPPTVPEGTARLRLSICANHSLEQIDALLVALSVCLQSERLA
jgi:8-amino-7-oxononanoate synthase